MTYYLTIANSANLKVGTRFKRFNRGRKRDLKNGDTREKRIEISWRFSKHTLRLRGCENVNCKNTGLLHKNIIKNILFIIKYKK